MSQLPYLVFDNSAVLLHLSRITVPNAGEKFLSSLKPGDRFVFTSFCAENFDVDDPCCKVFELDGFSDYSYAFLEKIVFRGNVVNIVYFAADFDEFHEIVSPNSKYYRNFTGQCIHEILSASCKGASASYLTPSAFLALDKIPHLRDELLRDERFPELCDIRIITERMVERARRLPIFRKTKIQLEHSGVGKTTENTPSERAAGIIEFSIPAYIYLFASLIHIFNALSDDHRIRIETLSDASSDASHGFVRFYVKVPDSRAIKGEMGSLAELERYVPSLSSIAEIAAFVAYDAKISTAITYDSENQTLCTSVKLGSAVESMPTFHHRDPYTGAPDIFEEFAQFVQMLMDGAA